VTKPAQGDGIRRRRRWGSGLASIASAASLCLYGTGCAALALTETATADAYPTRPPAAELLGPYPVTRVADGDTITIDRGSGPERLRFVGVDTPELHDARKPVECFSQQASEYTKSLLGQHIYLETDPSQDATDRYGRILAYIWTQDGRLFNLDLIASGYGHEYTYRTPHRYQNEFRAAETAARTNHIGMWSPANCPN